MTVVSWKFNPCKNTLSFAPWVTFLDMGLDSFVLPFNIPEEKVRNIIGRVAEFLQLEGQELCFLCGSYIFCQ